MSTSLSTLRAKVRRYIKESTADRWTDADLNAFINEGIVFIQGEIESANPDWFLRIETFTASAGSYQAAMPGDIWGNRLRSMYCYPSSTVPSGVPYRVSPGPLESILDSVFCSGVAPLNYSMLAGYVRWAPMLLSDSCFRYVYSLKETPLTGDTDNMGRIADEHADLVAIYASIIAVDSVNGNTQSLENRLSRGLMKMKSDVVPTDPLMIPQARID